MGIIGTGIAAGVANAAQTARQQTAAQSGKEARRADARQQTEKINLAQLHDAAATQDTDQDLPEQHPLGYEDLYQQNNPDAVPHPQADPNDANRLIHASDAPPASPAGIPLRPTYDPDADAPLFHAINLKA